MNEILTFHTIRSRPGPEPACTEVTIPLSPWGSPRSQRLPSEDCWVGVRPVDQFTKTGSGPTDPPGADGFGNKAAKLEER